MYCAFCNEMATAKGYNQKRKRDVFLCAAHTRMAPDGKWEPFVVNVPAPETKTEPELPQETKKRRKRPNTPVTPLDASPGIVEPSTPIVEETPSPLSTEGILPGRLSPGELIRQDLLGQAETFERKVKQYESLSTPEGRTIVERGRLVIRLLRYAATGEMDRPGFVQAIRTRNQAEVLCGLAWYSYEWEDYQRPPNGEDGSIPPDPFAGTRLALCDIGILSAAMFRRAQAWMLVFAAEEKKEDNGVSTG